jgi:hypothetical protein
VDSAGVALPADLQSRGRLLRRRHCGFVLDPRRSHAGRISISSIRAQTLSTAIGAGLLATKATEYVGNPFLYIKIPAIGLALLNVFLVRRSPAWSAHKNRDLTYTERRRLAAMGGSSLFFWLTSIGAGRMIGYW